MVLDGIVPVCRHTPPTVPARSTTAARRPSLAAAMAAFCPPGPLPMTSRSKVGSIALPEEGPMVSAREQVGRAVEHRVVTGPLDRRHEARGRPARRNTVAVGHRGADGVVAGAEADRLARGRRAVAVG